MRQAGRSLPEYRERTGQREHPRRHRATRARGRAHHAARPPVRRRRGDPLLRHRGTRRGDRVRRRHQAGHRTRSRPTISVCGRSRPTSPARARDRHAARPRDRPHPHEGARGTAHRLRRRAVHHRELPDRGRPVAHLRPHQDADARRTGALDRPHDRHRRACRSPRCVRRSKRVRARYSSSTAGPVRWHRPTTSGSSFRSAVTCSKGCADLAVPRIHFGVGTGELLTLMAAAGADVVGVDWRVPLDRARDRIGDARALQGNLDPAICLAPWEVVARRGARRAAPQRRPTRTRLQPRPRRAAGNRSRHVAARRRARARRGARRWLRLRTSASSSWPTAHPGRATSCSTTTRTSGAARHPRSSYSTSWPTATTPSAGCHRWPSAPRRSGAAIARGLDARDPDRFAVVLGQRHASPVHRGRHRASSAEPGVTTGGRARPRSALRTGKCRAIPRAGRGRRRRARLSTTTRSTIGTCCRSTCSSSLTAVDDARTELPATHKILFSAHSLPERVLEGDPYPDELRATASAVAASSISNPGPTGPFAGKALVAPATRGEDPTSTTSSVTSRSTGRADGVLGVPTGLHRRRARGVVRHRHPGSPSTAEDVGLGLRANPIAQRRPRRHGRARRSDRRPFPSMMAKFSAARSWSARASAGSLRPTASSATLRASTSPFFDADDPHRRQDRDDRARRSTGRLRGGRLPGTRARSRGSCAASSVSTTSWSPQRGESAYLFTRGELRAFPEGLSLGVPTDLDALVPPPTW